MDEVQLLNAIADPTRLRILRQLAECDSVCACDIAACFDLRQPTVSHHLRVLRQAGLVESQRRGTWVWYAIRPEAVERLREVIDSFASAGAASLPADRRLPVLQARAAGLS